MPHIIDGKAFAAQVREGIAEEVAQLKTAHGITPGLAVVLVGDDPASEVYVRNKGKACRAAGMESFEFKLPADTPQTTLLAKVAELNADPNVHGILVQLPLPQQIDEAAVIQAIDPAKDVDGFHVINSGKLMIGQDGLVPCTPLGCLMLLKAHYASLQTSARPGAASDGAKACAATERKKILSGLHAVVLGRSNIVGKPVAQLLLQEHCTVTVCHSRTRDLEAITRQADILIAAIGKPQMVKADWIKPGATVIDVGINRIDVGGGKAKLVGDIDFAHVSEVAGAITPVPGGVGPMTIACLLKNTVTAAQQFLHSQAS